MARHSRSRFVLTVVLQVVLGVLGVLASTSPAGAQPRRVAYDFTGDGTSDLLLRQGASLGFWDFDAGVARPVYLGAVDTPWTIVGAGDYNGDRTSDIMFRHATTGAVGYWSIIDGRLSAFVPLRWDTGADWQVISSRKRADFDGDGRDDLLWRRDSGEVGIYFLRSGAPFDFSWVPLGTVDPTWQVIGTGDFDGDSRDDILWRQSAGGAVGYWRMNATVEAWVPLASMLESDWRLETIADFDGDGDDDIYWRRWAVTVVEGYWRMAGGSNVGFIWTASAFDSVLFSLSFTSGDYYGRGHEDIVAARRGVGPPGPPLPRTLFAFDFVGGIAGAPRSVGSESYWTIQ